MKQPNWVIVNVPPKQGTQFSLRNPDVEDPAHAKLLGVTFSNLIVEHAHPDFVKSVFDELSKHFIRRTFEKVRNEIDGRTP